jgi:hypothetical protein
MAHIIKRKRVYGGYKYEKCPECKTDFETEKPVELDLPYCSACNKNVLDIAQNYCCWCGEIFNGTHDLKNEIKIYRDALELLVEYNKKGLNCYAMDIIRCAFKRAEAECNSYKTTCGDPVFCGKCKDTDCDEYPKG